MKRTIAFCIILLSICQIAESQVPYVSPGLGFFWDFAGHFILSPKLSVGVLQNGIFYNITVGRSSSSDEKYYPNYYVEVQCGKLTEPMEYRKTQLFYGGGIGLTIPASDNESNVSFRVSAFTGYFVFLNATILFREKLQTEIGGQVVLPIPLKGIEFGPGKI
jgi:hypothetical protein